MAVPIGQSKRGCIDGIHGASGGGEGLIGIEVLGISGECMLTLNVPDSMLGRELWANILDILPFKPGRQLVLSHNTSELVLHESLLQQGFPSERAQVSATYIPVNLLAALRFAYRDSVEDNEFLSNGITEMTGLSDKMPALPCCTICPRAFGPWHLHLVSMRDFIMSNYQQACKVWLLVGNSISTSTTWHGQQAFKVWVLVRNSISTSTTWHGQQAFKDWVLVRISIRAWTRWHGHQAFKVWVLVRISIRAWTAWHGQQVFKIWLLVRISIKAWTTWHGHQAFKVWVLVRISIRAWTAWHGQQVFKIWLLVRISIKAWTTWHGQQGLKV